MIRKKFLIDSDKRSHLKFNTNLLNVSTLKNIIYPIFVFLCFIYCMMDHRELYSIQLSIGLQIKDSKNNKNNNKPLQYSISDYLLTNIYYSIFNY